MMLGLIQAFIYRKSTLYRNVTVVHFLFCYNSIIVFNFVIFFFYFLNFLPVSGASCNELLYFSGAQNK